MKKVLIVFGTRPEAIKLAPVIKEIKKNGNLKPFICVFRQHKEMLDQVLETFEIKPDFDLPISINDKDLLGGEVGPLMRAKTLIQSGWGFLRFLFLLKREKPDLLVVQGDTSTVFLAGFFAYLFKVPIAHVEAGLRTYDKYAPFPEEMNRQLLGRLADIHFAPTEGARKNLLSENVPPEKIHVVGNTEIDALLWVLDRHKDPCVRKELERDLEKNYGLQIGSKKRSS
ncbi:MAG: UDP-N-acetylglucosamine 2-epimerase (non-hydrolyzing) [Candidatus Jorgensenbacteria bacterium]